MITTSLAIMVAFGDSGLLNMVGWTCRAVGGGGEGVTAEAIGDVILF